MMSNFRHRQQIQSGFTLVEAMVAITILLVGVVGPLSILGRGIADGLFARNQIAANFLAQEGLELAMNRNQNNLSNLSVLDMNGLDKFNSCLDFTCVINPDNLEFVAVGSTTDDLFILNGISFTRHFSVEIIDSNRAKVKVRVGWDNLLAPRELVLQTYVYK